jgi:excisionase family DNA binding protein
MIGTDGHISGHTANQDHRKHRSQFFTVRAIAEQLDVSPRTVHRWIKNNELVVHRVGRSVRVSAADLNQFIEARRDDD